jgi:hypothetical protein
MLQTVSRDGSTRNSGNNKALANSELQHDLNARASCKSTASTLLVKAIPITLALRYFAAQTDIQLLCVLL